jgi:hypothetical protein
VFVPSERILAWEGLFRRYKRLEREIFYHAMNFIISPPMPLAFPEKFPIVPFEPQMRSLPEIAKQIEEIRAEFAKEPVFKR